MKRILLILLASVVPLTACDKKGTDEEETQSPSDSPPQEVTQPAASIANLQPPTPRLVLPPALRTLRLSNDAVGTIADAATPERKLNGFGVASCQTGWTFQGLYFNDDEDLVATAPITVQMANLPTGKTIRYVDPDVPDRAILLDFEQFGLEQIRGTVEVLDTTNDERVLTMAIDGAPTTLMRAPGLGPAGCFDTGFWKASFEGDDVFGPAIGVYDPTNLHYVGLRLSPTVNLVLLFTLKESERGRGDVIRTTFEKIAEKPDLIPMRGYIEIRENESEPGAETGPLITTRELPLTRGSLVASFPTGAEAGPIRIVLKDVKLPDWDSPWSGVELTKLRAEVLFVTDTDGEEVPLPSQPDWFERPPVVLP